MEEPLIKEEVSDGEDADIDGGKEIEGKVFLAEPMKIENLTDSYECNSGTGVESSELTEKVDVTEDEHMCRIKQETVKEIRRKEILAESTPSTSSCVNPSPPGNSVERAFDGASSDDVIRTRGKSDMDAEHKRHGEKPPTRNRTECETANIGIRLSDCAVSSEYFLESKSSKQLCHSGLNVCAEESGHSKELFSSESNDQNGNVECNDCKQGFKSKNHLNEHVRAHAGDKPFECDECERKFSDKRYLKAHQKIHSSAREKTFECKECKQKFSRKNHLRDHVRIHTGEKPFHCDQCDDKFSQKSNLKGHQRRVHAKLLECHECGQKFLEMGHLIDHLRVHTGEKPFECEKCGEAFSRRFTLRYHQRTHGVEKPFECDQCHRTFLRKCLLQSHKRVHTSLER